MRRIGVIVLMGGLGFGGGCVPVPDPVLSVGFSAAQAGASAFIQGELRAAMKTSIRQLFDATMDAAGEKGLRFEISDSQFREDSAVITCRETGDEDHGGNRRVIEIIMRKSSPGVTTISIQVGTFGDQPMSRLVLDEIRHKLSPNQAMPDATAQALPAAQGVQR